MNKNEITDPYILKIMELIGKKEGNLNTIADDAELVYIVEYSKYCYFIGEIQYLLLKKALEENFDKEFTLNEVKTYCIEQKESSAYPLKKMIRYVAPPPLKIKINDDDKLKAHINNLICKINIRNQDSRFFKILGDRQIKYEYLSNYYDCITGAENYIKFKEMGIEDYFERQKQREEEFGNNKSPKR